MRRSCVASPSSWSSTDAAYRKLFATELYKLLNDYDTRLFLEDDEYLRQAYDIEMSKRRTEKRDVKVKTVEDRLCWKLVGVTLVVLAVFLALALATFDWESVRILCENPRETTNLIGVLGNGVAYGAYVAFGLAAWCFPLAFLIGGLKLLESIPKEVEEIPNRKVWLLVG